MIFFSFYSSVFSEFSIISIWLLSPCKNVKEEGEKSKKTGCSDSDLLLQVEAGKGLEMRKLVLSGFLASEEIYINQLEALLLVSMYFGVFVLCDCVWNWRERWTSPSQGQGLWNCPAYGLAAKVIARRGPCLLAPILHYLPWER